MNIEINIKDNIIRFNDKLNGNLKISKIGFEHIKPFKIFKICGNSSIDNFRNQWPERVIHRWGSERRWVGMLSGALVYIVLNLGIIKVSLWIPTRFCQNRTGPGESSFTIRANTNKGIAKTINPARDKTISRNLCTKRRYITYTPL